MTSWQNITTGAYTRLFANSGCGSIGSIHKKVFPGTEQAAFSSDKWYAAAGLRRALTGIMAGATALDRTPSPRRTGEPAVRRSVVIDKSGLLIRTGARLIDIQGRALQLADAQAVERRLR